MEFLRCQAWTFPVVYVFLPLFATIPSKLPPQGYLPSPSLLFSFPLCLFSPKSIQLLEGLSNTNGIIQSFPGSKYSGGEGEYLSNTNAITQSFPGSKYSGREGEYLSNTNGITQSYPVCKYSGGEGEYLSNTNGITQSFPGSKYS